LVFLVASFLLVLSPIPYMHSASPHTCYLPCPSHPPWLSHSEYMCTWRIVQVMKLLIMQFSPNSYHFISLQSKFTWAPHSQTSSVCVPTLMLRRVHITRARRETCLAFTCARKSSSTLLQSLARLRRVRIRIFTRSVYRLLSYFNLLAIVFKSKIKSLLVSGLVISSTLLASIASHTSTSTSNVDAPLHLFTVRGTWLHFTLWRAQYLHLVLFLHPYETVNSDTKHPQYDTCNIITHPT
jgi:hypothetical protein